MMMVALGRVGKLAIFVLPLTQDHSGMVDIAGTAHMGYHNQHEVQYMVAVLVTEGVCAH